MGSNIPKTRPDGMADFALTHTVKEIAEQFNVTEHVARGWVRRMQPAWKAKRLEHMQSRERSKVPRNRKLSRAAFFNAAMTMPQNDVATFLNIGKATVHRYMQELTDDQRKQVRDASLARRAAKSEETAAKSRRAQVQKRRETRREERASPHKRLKTPGKKSGVNWGFNKPADIAPVKGGLAEDAAQFLRRRNSVVCRGETINAALKGYWIVGARPAMSPDDMIEMARRGGFNPDAWRQVAA